MTYLQKEFEATGYTSWINADLYPDGKIYTQEYTQWLERQVLALRQLIVSWKSENLSENDITSCPKCKSTDHTMITGQPYKCMDCGHKWV